MKQDYFLMRLFPLGYRILGALGITEKRAMAFRSGAWSRDLYSSSEAPERNLEALCACITYFILFSVICIPFSLFAGDLFLSAAMFVAVAAVTAEPMRRLYSRSSERRYLIMKDYMQVLLKFSLLINTGMVLSDVFSTVAESRSGQLYDLMKDAGRRTENGMSLNASLAIMSDECGIREIRKFISVISRSSSKGTAELGPTLDALVRETFEKRKTEARKKGETAGQKLLVPIIVMFIGIVMTIVVPVFSSIMI